MPTSAPTVGKLERILSLKRLPILSALSPDDLAAMAEHARERLFAKGSVVLREGEPVPAIYAVLDGLVEVRRRGRTLGHIGAGGLVGGIALLARDNEGMDCTAESDTLTLELERDALLEVFEDHFPILHHVLREVCRGLIDQVGELPAQLYSDIFPIFSSADLPPGDLDFVERILFLRQVSAFAHSSINALAELARGMAEVSFPAGTRLWEEGEAPGGVLLVVSGTVAATARAGTASFTIGPGASLGTLASLAERPHWHGAVTQTPLTALQGSIEGLVDVFEDHFEIAMDYLETVARAELRLVELRVSEGGPALYGVNEKIRPSLSAPPRTVAP